MAKLSTLAFTRRADVGAVLVLQDPTNPSVTLFGADGSPSTLTLLGIDASAARRHTQARAATLQSRLYASAFSKTRKTELSPDVTPDVTPDDVAEQEESEISLLVSLTVDWSGFESDDGAPLPCTPEHVRDLYVQCPPIRTQAMNFINDRASFFSASAMSSAPSLIIASD